MNITGRQADGVNFFFEKYPELPPFSQRTVSKIKKQFRDLGHVKAVPRRRRTFVDKDTTLALHC